MNNNLIIKMLYKCIKRTKFYVRISYYIFMWKIYYGIFIYSKYKCVRMYLFTFNTI